MSENEVKTVLFVHYGSQWLRGSERTLLDILEHLPRQEYEPIVWTNNRVLADELKKLDMECIVSDFKLIAQYQSPMLPIWSWLRQIVQALQLIRRHKVSLIHINSGGPCQWMTLASRMSGVPCLAQIHCCYSQRDRFVLFTHLANRISCVSQAVADGYTMDKQSVPVTINHNGIDQERFSHHTDINIREVYNFKPDDFILLSVGSLIKRKGYDKLVQAVAQLHQQGFAIRLILIGEGSERRSLENLVKQYKLSDSIIFAGEQKMVGGYYRAEFDAFISTTRVEAFGLVNAEAAMHGLPVIAPNIDGLKDIFTKPEHAQFISRDTTEDIATAIKHLYENPERRKSIAQSGQQRIKQHFLIQHNMERLLNDYCLLMNNTTKKERRVGVLSYLKELMTTIIIPAVTRRRRLQSTQGTISS